MKRKIPILVLIVCIGISPGFSEDVYLSIDKGMSSLKFAFPEIITPEDSPEKTVEKAATIRKTVLEDLDLTGVFSIIGEKYYRYVPPTKPGKIPYKEWKSVGADILLLLNLKLREDRIVLESRLFDVESRQRIMGKRYKGSTDALRRMAHTISDEILYHYTGNRGLFTSMITFVSNREGGKSIYVTDYDGKNVRRLSDNKELTLTPDWSPEGEKIIYTAYAGEHPNLYVYNWSTGQRRRLTSNKGLTTGGSYSPDGKKIVFSSSRTGNSEIYAMDKDGENVRQLTENEGIDTAPCWSPNGREIAFTSDRSGVPQIYVMSTEGDNLRRISRGFDYCDSPAWSPGGDKIAFSARKKRYFKIVFYDIESGKVEILKEGDYNCENPSWSPGGNMLCYASNRSGKWNIYIIDKLGKNEIRITTEGDNQTPEWGP